MINTVFQLLNMDPPAIGIIGTKSAFINNRLQNTTSVPEISDFASHFGVRSRSESFAERKRQNDRFLECGLPVTRIWPIRGSPRYFSRPGDLCITTLHPAGKY